jgi:hypothetical protein
VSTNIIVFAATTMDGAKSIKDGWQEQSTISYFLSTVPKPWGDWLANSFAIIKHVKMTNFWIGPGKTKRCLRVEVGNKKPTLPRPELMDCQRRR